MGVRTCRGRGLATPPSLTMGEPETAVGVVERRRFFPGVLGELDGGDESDFVGACVRCATKIDTLP